MQITAPKKLHAMHRTPLTSKIRRYLDRVICTWNLDNCVLLLIILLDILCCRCLILRLILSSLLICRRLLTGLLLLINILLLTLCRLLLRGLRRTQWNLNICTRNCQCRLTTTNCTISNCAHP